MSQLATGPANAIAERSDVAAPPTAEYFIRFGYGVIAAVFGGLLLWSILAPISGAVVASGQLVVESNRKTVQHLEGGVVGEILVSEGDVVGAQEVVARLDDTVPRANAALIDSQLTELYARRARLVAERDDGDTLAEPTGVSAVLQSSAFLDKLAGQERLFAARLETRRTQIALLQERIIQRTERIEGLTVQIDSIGEQRRLIQDELDGVIELHEEGFAPLTRVRALQREAERLDGERGRLVASVAEARSVIAESQLEIERLEDEGREAAISDLRDVEVSIAELEERRVTAQEALRRTEIIAPQGGRVLGLNVHTVGGVVAPGSPLMQIVPEGDRLQVSARIAPQDVDRVQTGQETLIRFTAFGARMTPEALGAVDTVSADTMRDEATGAAYYLVLIDLPEDLTDIPALRERALAPGMPVETFIRTGSKPALSYLLKPLPDAAARSLREE